MHKRTANATHNQTEALCRAAPTVPHIPSADHPRSHNLLVFHDEGFVLVHFIRHRENLKLLGMEGGMVGSTHTAWGRGSFEGCGSRRWIGSQGCQIMVGTINGSGYRRGGGFSTWGNLEGKVSFCMEVEVPPRDQLVSQCPQQCRDGWEGQK